MNDDYKINIPVSGNILDNSIDLLLDGVESIKKRRSSLTFFSPTPELKSALLAITTGIELLLKAKIASLNWKELFQHTEKADKSKIEDGDFFSIKFEDCLRRIESISNIVFDPKTKFDIDQIRKTRNKITHYHYDSRDNEILTLIANAIGIYLEFYRNHIFEPFCEEVDRTKYIDRDLKDLKEYVRIRVKIIEEIIKDKPKPITYHFNECPECLQGVTILKDAETLLCYFCRREADIRETAMGYSNFKEQVKHCSCCGHESMAAVHESADEQEAWQCIICGFYINRPEKWGLGNGKSSNDSIREELRTPGYLIGKAQ